MLKIIRRVLRLSGNLSKRIWGSFICGFLESMFGLLPIAAVFLVLIELQNGQPITGQTWGIVIGLIAGSVSIVEIRFVSVLPAIFLHYHPLVLQHCDELNQLVVA